MFLNLDKLRLDLAQVLLIINFLSILNFAQR